MLMVHEQAIFNVLFVGCAPIGRVRSGVERTNNCTLLILVRRKALRTLQRMILIMFGRVRSDW
jgi:hypothetical protein